MRLELIKKPKNPVIIEGFPGIGLIGTITTEFLIEHLGCEFIGRFWFEELPPTLAIHEGKLVNPMEIYHDKKHNIVIVHSISGANSTEWKAADMINEVIKATSAKELICLEGIASASMGEDVYYYTNNSQRQKKIDKCGIRQINEGIIMGVTAALILKTKIPNVCFFAETHSALPDSKAAAKVIEVLDKYMLLNVDYKPLLDQAAKFEQKLRSLLQKSKEAEVTQKRHQMTYVG